MLRDEEIMSKMPGGMQDDDEDFDNSLEDSAISEKPIVRDSSPKEIILRGTIQTP